MKRRLKILSIGILSILFLFVLSLLIYTKIAWKNCVTDKEFNDLILQINSAKPLPSNFTSVYGKMHPGFYNNDLSILDYKQQGSYNPPSLSITWSLFCNTNSIKNKLTKYSLTKRIESHTTQLACHSFVMKRNVYYSGEHSIWEVSNLLFDTPLDSISQEQCIELILLSKAPTKFNRKRNPENVEKMVKMWSKRLAN